MASLFEEVTNLPVEREESDDLERVSESPVSESPADLSSSSQSARTSGEGSAKKRKATESPVYISDYSKVYENYRDPFLLTGPRPLIIPDPEPILNLWKRRSDRNVCYEKVSSRRVQVTALHGKAMLRETALGLYHLLESSSELRDNTELMKIFDRMRWFYQLFYSVDVHLTEEPQQLGKSENVDGYLKP